MQFRPARVVTVTTPEELDSAFASADRLIVEGDDALLSYAATKAAEGTGTRSRSILPPMRRRPGGARFLP